MERIKSLAKFSLLSLVMFMMSCQYNRDNSVQSGPYKVSYNAGWFDKMMEWLLTWGVVTLVVVFLILGVIALGIWIKNNA